MIVSFDGLRKNLSRSYNSLISLINDAEKADDKTYVIQINKADLSNKLNDLKMYVDFLNSSYSDENDQDMNDLSDIILKRYDPLNEYSEDDEDD